MTVHISNYCLNALFLCIQETLDITEQSYPASNWIRPQSESCLWTCVYWVRSNTMSENRWWIERAFFQAGKRALGRLPQLTLCLALCLQQWCALIYWWNGPFCNSKVLVSDTLSAVIYRSSIGLARRLEIEICPTKNYPALYHKVVITLDCFSDLEPNICYAKMEMNVHVHNIFLQLT